MAFLVFLPETYGPILLLQRARHIRKHDPKANVVAPHELDRPDLKQLATRVLTRPLRMIFFELIVTASCMYLALVYAIFYMTFQAFPLIFQDLYGLSPGVCGLTFLTIGAGAFVSLPIFWWYDGYLHRATIRNASWTHQEEYRRLPLACVGGPMFVISLFWLGWTSRLDVPFWVPMLAGIPFGLGFMLIFMALVTQSRLSSHRYCVDSLIVKLPHRCLRDLCRLCECGRFMLPVLTGYCFAVCVCPHVQEAWC